MRFPCIQPNLHRSWLFRKMTVLSMNANVFDMYDFKRVYYNQSRVRNSAVRFLSGGMVVRGRLSVSQYRSIDLFLFALMTVVFETVAVLAARSWFPGEPYAISVVPVVTAIVMVRWGWPGLMHAALGGVVFCLASRGGMQQILVYGVGNLAAAGALGLIRLWGSERIRGSSWLTLAYGACVVLLQQAGRALISLIFGARLTSVLGFFTTDVITMLFTLTVLWIVRRLDGVFEDQKHYLARVWAEQNTQS